MRVKMEPIHTHGYPTVLLAHDDEVLRSTLGDCLRREGYHVLEAQQWTTVFDLVKVHSRPIHLLVADVSMEARLSILKMHRSSLQVLLVKRPFDAGDVLAKVRQLLRSPPSSIR